MVPSFTMEERGFLALEYYKHGCYAKAKEEYTKQFPGRPVPSNKTILRFFRKIRFYGCAEDKKYSRKAPVTENEEIIQKTLEKIRENPDWSIRRLSRETGISKRSCSTILEKHKIKLNHHKFSKYKKIDEQLQLNNSVITNTLLSISKLNNSESDKSEVNDALLNISNLINPPLNDTETKEPQLDTPKISEPQSNDSPDIITTKEEETVNA
uniref:DUF4817 domain-containing protein n=1 Tax=Strongyloides venezuelensis TaxID=75913 RepID=A0A0K0F4X6_STRVS